MLRNKLVATAKRVDAEPAPAETAVCASAKKLTFDPSSDAHDTDYMMLDEAKRGGAKAIQPVPEGDAGHGRFICRLHASRSGERRARMQKELGLTGVD